MQNPSQVRHAILALCFSVLTSGSSLAADAGDETLVIAPTSAQAESQVAPGGLKDERLSLKPELGLVAYSNSASNKTAQAAEGVGIEWNGTHAFGIDPNWYFGISSGAIFSSLPDTRLLFIPVDLKEGYNFTDYYRISVHAGGNVVYRSLTQAINLSSGGGDQFNANSSWIIYPNVGIDLDVALGKNLAIFLRPDFTLAPSSAIFLGTLGLGWNFG